MFWGNTGPSAKSIFFTETTIHYNTSILRQTNLYKLQSFTCPMGMIPFDTSDPTIYPKLCRSNVVTSISIKVKRQQASCPAHRNPCHPSSGDKSRAETDFVFAGRPFTRHYHSLREIRGEWTDLGNGWTHTYQAKLEKPGAGWRLLTPDGYFAPYSAYSVNGSIIYIATNYGNAIVQKQADETWHVKEQNGDVSVYDTSGRLTAVRNDQDHSRNVTLVYEAARDGAYNSNSRRIAWAIDASGRMLQFLYGANDLLIGFHLPDGREIRYDYDENTNLVAVDYGGGQIKRYHYGEVGLAPNGDVGLLTGITSENGQRYASFGYDIYGRVKSSVLHGPNGPVDTTYVRYTSASGAEAEVNGVTNSYTYSNDMYRKPLITTNAAGAVTRTYDGQGHMLSSTDARGVLIQNTYSGGRLTKTIEAANDTTGKKRTMQIDWHASFNVPVERRTLNASNAAVAKGNWTYNVRGQVLTASHTDPISNATRATSTTYCEQPDVDAGACPRIGLVTSVDGPRTDLADTTTYTYYPANHPDCSTSPTTCAWRKGDLWKVDNAQGQVVETLAYDGAGRPLSVKDYNGIVTDYEYHPRGWLTVTKVRGLDDGSETDDRITSIEYWPTGLVKKVTQPDGAFTTYTYDAAHRLTTIGDNAGNTLNYTLDNAGNRIQEETRDASGALRRTLSRLYNQLGQLATQADAGDNPTDFTYDPNGNLKTVTDPLNRATSNDYDPLNRLVRTLQDVGGIEAETTFEYDALDHLTKVTDPKGLETGYTYNAFGDLLQLDSPDTGTTTYTYDSAGNRTGQVDARGQASSYAYDALNRLTGIGYAGAPEQDVAYVYDTVQPACEAGETFAVGRLSAMADASGSTQYCYDRFGQLVRKAQTTNGRTFTLRYAYTKSGQLSRLTYPDGSAADYVRDAQGRVTEVGVTSPGGSREVLLTGAGYAPFGPATGWAYGNGRTLGRTHDLDYRPESILDGATGGLDLGYGYDPAGNLTALRTADLAEPPRATFAYDALNRLTAFRDGAVGTAIESYAYDATGNRTGFTNAGGAQSYAYPTDSHRLTSAAGVPRSYDAVGNTTTIGSAREFVYNAANRLSQVKQGDVVTMRYAYNGKGERVRSYAGSDDLTTLYDETGQWLGDYDATTGAPIQQAIWLDDNPVGLLVGMAGVNRLHYVQPDHLGTPRSVIDPIRNVAVWNWDLASEAFGNSPPNQDPDNDGTSFVFDMRFPGQRYDAASGLNYNYFRDYEPGTGRYPQSDPIGLADGPSTYGYAYQMPLIATDPSGLAGATGVVPWNPGVPPWVVPLGRQFLGILGRGGVLGGLYPYDMGQSSCEASGANFNQCMADKYPSLPFPIVQPRSNTSCPEGEDERCRKADDRCYQECSPFLGQRDGGSEYVICWRSCMKAAGCYQGNGHGGNGITWN